MLYSYAYGYLCINNMLMKLAEELRQTQVNRNKLLFTNEDKSNYTKIRVLAKNRAFEGFGDVMVETSLLTNRVKIALSADGFKFGYRGVGRQRIHWDHIEYNEEKK